MDTVFIVASPVHHGDVMHEFDTIIIEDETGGYVAPVPVSPGCHTQGDTSQELMENAEEAIELCHENFSCFF